MTRGTPKPSTTRPRSRLGQSGPLSGFQLFVKLNCVLVFLGELQITAPNAKPEFPATPPSALTITNISDTVAIKLTADAATADFTNVWASRPLSAGINSTSAFYYIGQIPAPVGGFSIITSLYTAKFGVPAAGKKIFVRVSQVVDAWQDLPHEWSAIVPTSS